MDVTMNHCTNVFSLLCTVYVIVNVLYDKCTAESKCHIKSVILTFSHSDQTAR